MYPHRATNDPSGHDPSPHPGRVLLVGMGALGCAAARTIASAGVHQLTLVDPDVVELSNLQRQVLFGEDDIGRPKAEAAAAALAEGSPRAEATALVASLGAQNAEELFAAHDFVVDACDDPATKYLINATAIATGRPYCYGGVVRTGGQVMSVEPGRSACLACVFPLEEGNDADGAGCADLGILAPAAGVVGSLQGLEALRALGPSAQRRSGRMTLYEVRARRFRYVDFPRDTSCAACAPAARKENREPENSEPRRLLSCHS